MMAMTVKGHKDHYDTLGVPRNASTAQIKAAYQKLRWQDPANGGSSALGEAFDVLKNPKRRAAYDRSERGRRVRAAIAGLCGAIWQQVGRRPAVAMKRIAAHIKDAAVIQTVTPEFVERINKFESDPTLVAIKGKEAADLLPRAIREALNVEGGMGKAAEVTKVVLREDGSVKDIWLKDTRGTSEKTRVIHDLEQTPYGFRAPHYNGAGLMNQKDGVTQAHGWSHFGVNEKDGSLIGVGFTSRPHAPPAILPFEVFQSQKKPQFGDTDATARLWHHADIAKMTENTALITEIRRPPEVVRQLTGFGKLLQTFGVSLQPQQAPKSHPTPAMA